MSINGQSITDWKQVAPFIKNRADHMDDPSTVPHIVVSRDGQLHDYYLPLTKALLPNGETRALAGVASKPHVPQPGFLTSVAEAPRQTADAGWASIKALGTMFSPSGISNYWHVLSGDQGKNVKQDQRFVSPVGFGSLANDAVKAGWVSVFGLLISINIFVGLLNLVPLLPFDGGHIAVATYEKIASTIRRRRVQVDITKLMPLTVAVLGILAFIFLSSLFLDVTNPVKNPF